jgi:hypothetical protein
MGNETNIDEFKPKLYNSMDNPEDDSMEMDIVEDNRGESLNKGKGVDRKVHPHPDGYKPTEATPPMPQATEPPLSI